MNSATTTVLVNKTPRLFALTEREVTPHFKADLVSRGWDGTAWFGFTPAEGKRKESRGLFYRNAKSNQFSLVCGT